MDKEELGRFLAPFVIDRKARIWIDGKTKPSKRFGSLERTRALFVEKIGITLDWDVDDNDPSKPF